MPQSAGGARGAPGGLVAAAVSAPCPTPSPHPHAVPPPQPRIPHPLPHNPVSPRPPPPCCPLPSPHPCGHHPPPSPAPHTPDTHPCPPPRLLPCHSSSPSGFPRAFTDALVTSDFSVCKFEIPSDLQASARACLPSCLGVAVSSYRNVVQAARWGRGRLVTPRPLSLTPRRSRANVENRVLFWRNPSCEL